MAARRIQGITIEIGGDTTKLEKALKDVNKSISGTQSSLKDVNNLLKLNPGNVELLTQKQGYLTNAIDATKEKLEKEKTALAQLKANSTTGEVTAEQQALEREIIATQGKLKSLTEEYRTFGSVGGQQLQAAGANIKSAGEQMQTVGKTMTTHVTTPIVAGFTAAVKTAADFDTQMSKVGAITGATGDDMDAMREKAREMGAKTKFSATEAGQAMEYMGMAGWKTSDIVDGLEGIMNLAAASGEELGTTSDIVTDALTAFGLSAKDSGHFADVLAAASTNANTNVSMMGETFKYAAPVAGSLGYSAEDTAIAIGLMANSGIKASQAGTALRTGMTNLVKPTDQMQAAMDKYGISVTDSNGKMLSMRDLTAQLRKRLGGLSEAEQTSAAAAIFGKNAMSGWLAIINASDEDVKKLTDAVDHSSDKMGNYNGAAEQMAATMQDNLQGQLTILMSQLQELAISFGEIAMPVVKEFVGMIQNVVDWFNKLSPATKETIAKIAALAAAIGPVLLVGGKLISGVGSVMTVAGKLQGAIAGGGGLIKTIGALIGAAGPLMAGGAAVAAVVAGGVLIYKNWDKIKAGAKTLVKNVKSAWNDFKTATANAFENIKKSIKTKWEQAVTNIKTGASNIVSNIKTNFENAKTNAVNAFEGLKSGVKSRIEAVMTTVSTIAGNIATTAKSKFDTVKTNAEAAFGQLKSAAKTNFEAAQKTIETAATNIANKVKSGITDALGKAKDKIGELAKGFSNFSWSSFATAATNIGSKVKNSISDALESAKKKIGDLAKGFSGFSWSSFSTAATNIGTKVKNSISNALESAKKKISDLANGFAGFSWGSFNTAASNISSKVKSNISDALGKAKDKIGELARGFSSFSWGTFGHTLGTISASVKTNITNAMDTAKSAVKGLADKFTGFSGFSFTNSLWSIGQSITKNLGGALSTAASKLSSLKEGLKGFSWNFPKPKLPHFSVTWKEITVPVIGTKFKIPGGISVAWYKKAYDTPIMFTSPTVLQTPQGPKGFGDGHGGEIVLSERKLREIAGGGATYNINVYGAEGQNVNALADAIQRRLVALERQREAAGLT